MTSEFSYYIKTHRRVELNDIMSFDHVIRVIHAGGKVLVIDAEEEYAPAVAVQCLDDDAGSITAEAEAEMTRRVEAQGWELMTGYSSQYLTKPTDAIMHPSEYIGGMLEDDILERPGLYAVTEPYGSYPTVEAEEKHAGDPIGWVVARKADES